MGSVISVNELPSMKAFWRSTVSTPPLSHSELSDLRAEVRNAIEHSKGLDGNEAVQLTWLSTVSREVVRELAMLFYRFTRLDPEKWGIEAKLDINAKLDIDSWCEALWDATNLLYGHHKEMVEWIEEAKRPRTINTSHVITMIGKAVGELLTQQLQWSLDDELYSPWKVDYEG